MLPMPVMPPAEAPIEVCVPPPSRVLVERKGWSYFRYIETPSPANDREHAA
jgi:hypothetical protein